jgi:alpha-ketoglutarate-dependent taurine dioxygenase
MSTVPPLAPVDDPAAWRAADVADRSQWEWRWTPKMLREIRSAIEQVKGRPPEALTRDHFALKECKSLLGEISAELDSGLGFAVIAGFPVEEYSNEDLVRAFVGVSAYLGNPVDQTSKGDRVIDVMDKGHPVDTAHRGYHSKSMLPFHTDGAYLVGLFFLETALRGGESLLASSMAVYNEMLRRYPERMPELLRGFYYDRRGDHPAGENPVSPERIPVFSFHNQLLHCCYNRNNINFAPSKTGVPLTDREVAALDAMDELARDPTVHYTMAMNKGDMQFVNNFVVLHSRTEFEDRPDGRQRHLIRLWLDSPEGRRHGPSLLDLYTSSERRFRKYEETLR